MSRERIAPYTKVLLAVGLFVLLGGPTPGYVGACGQESEASGAEEFCVEKEGWICARRRANGLYNDEERDLCLGMVAALCDNKVWKCDPPPSSFRTTACINALQAQDRISINENDLPECQNLCGTAGAATADGGV